MEKNIGQPASDATRHGESMSIIIIIIASREIASVTRCNYIQRVRVNIQRLDKTMLNLRRETDTPDHSRCIALEREKRITRISVDCAGSKLKNQKVVE